MFGPFLTLLYINDLWSYCISTTSHVRLLAADCLLYMAICFIIDHPQLQKDIKALTTWANTCGMSFNQTKSYILTTSQKRLINTFLYYLCGWVLSKVPTSKYLGVILSEGLQWNAHINTICASASRALEFLRRKLKTCPMEIQELAYWDFVLSKLECACSVWDQYLTKDKELLENIQRRGACFVHQDYRRSKNITNMLTSLDWDLPETRRPEARLGFVDRIVGGRASVNVGDYLWAPGHEQSIRLSSRSEH